MLVDRRSLAVQEICTNAGRYAIDHVRLESDGATAATDGRLLIAVESAGLDTGEYPNVGAVDMPAAGVIIPSDIAREAIKNMPKNMPHEHLNACAVTKAKPYGGENDDGEVELTTTDLKRTRRVGSSTTGTFPDWRSMFNGAAKTKETAAVTLSLPLLKKIVKTLEKVAGTDDDSDPSVTLHFRSGTKPVIINGYVGSRGRRFLGLLAPVKTRASSHEFNDWQKKLLGLEKITRKVK